MDSDFAVSKEQVNLYLTSQPDVPWITLRYIIAEANYGGRVTGDKDVRLISAVLKAYFNETMLKPGFRFAGLDAYSLPDEGTLQQTRDYLKTLPMDEDPRVFGLHPNALVTAQFGQSKKFHDTVTSVQPRIASGGGGKSSEEIVAEMAEDFLKIIPDAAKAKKAHPTTYQKTPDGGIISLGVFHSQEYTRFAKMIRLIKASLKMLGKAITGIRTERGCGGSVVETLNVPVWFFRLGLACGRCTFVSFCFARVCGVLLLNLPLAASHPNVRNSEPVRRSGLL
jgi:dynein heavy chain, axonemal